MRTDKFHLLEPLQRIIVKETLSDPLAAKKKFDGHPLFQGDDENLHIDMIGGACPTQSRGTMSDVPYYFRARWGRWNLYVGDKEYQCPLLELGGDLKDPMGGVMTDDEVEEILGIGSRLFTTLNAIGAIENIDTFKDQREAGKTEKVNVLTILNEPVYYRLEDDHSLTEVRGHEGLLSIKWPIKVGEHKQDGIFVSTVFLPAVHGHDEDGKPFLFETLYQDSRDDSEQIERYTSWDDAKAGHDEIVRRLQLEDENDFEL